MSKLIAIAHELEERYTETPHIGKEEMELHFHYLEGKVSSTAVRKALEVHLNRKAVMQDNRFRMAMQEAFKQGLITVKPLPESPTTSV